MYTPQKRTLTILVAALMAIAFLIGGASLTASAREFEPFDDRSLRPSELSSLVDMGEQPGEFELYGRLEAIGESSWTVAGQILTIVPGTEFKTLLQVGDFVKVHVFPYKDGLAIREIELSLPGVDAIDDNSNGSLDDNSNGSVDDNTNGSMDDNSNDAFDDQFGDDNSNDNDDNSGSGKNRGQG